MYKCATCKVDKPRDEFGSARGTKLGHLKKCKKCWAEYMRQYYKNNPKQYTKHKKYVEKNDITYKQSYSRHHISEEDFYKLLNKYDGKCYACRENTATCIDHDHSCCPSAYSCGSCIRGMLCNWCNSALGHSGDSVQKLYKLIDYLTASSITVDAAGLYPDDR